MNLALE